METNENSYIEVTVKGNSNELWTRLRQKLFEAVNNLLDTVVDERSGNTLREEAKEFSSLLLKFAKDHLNRPGLENQKIMAEIECLYSAKHKTLAETRKIHAEAGSIELQNRINALKLSLGVSKMLMIGLTDEKSILFLNEIDSLLELINKQYKI